MGRAGRRVREIGLAGHRLNTSIFSKRYEPVALSTVMIIVLPMVRNFVHVTAPSSVACRLEGGAAREGEKICAVVRRIVLTSHLHVLLCAAGANRGGLGMAEDMRA